MAQLKISETVDVGPSNTAGVEPNVFFVGTDTDTVDIGEDWSVQQFKKQYKKLDALSVENGFFVTSLPQYAIQYADNFASENASAPVILAMEFKKDIKFFDLASRSDYMKVDIDPDIANIFINAEPYFAINNQLDANKMPYQPYEFSVVKNLLAGSGPWDEIISKKNFSDKLKKINEPEKFEQMYNKWYDKNLVEPFEYLLGKNNPLISSVYMTQAFNSREDLISRLSADADAAAANNDTLKDRNRIHAKAKRKNSDGSVKTDDTQIGASIRGAWNSGATTMEDGLPSYMHTRKATDYPQSIVGTPLFNNYKLLSGKYKDADRNKDFKQFNISASWPLYNAYIKLFGAMHDFMNTPAALDDMGYIRLGLDAIKNRIKLKKTNDPAGKHIYIDIIQFICFSMILEKCKDKSLDIYGVATREKIGYDQIRDKKVGYGYKDEEMKGGYLQQNDRTLIICRPIPLDNIRIIGHDVTQLKRYDSFGQKYRQYVGSVKTIDEYMSQVKKLYSEIDDMRKADFDRKKRIKIFGRAHKIIDGEWNDAFFQHMSSYTFDGYTGFGELSQVKDWLTHVFAAAGYCLIFDRYSIYDNENVKSYNFDQIYINGSVKNMKDDRRDTRYSKTPEQVKKEIQSAIDKINIKNQKDTAAPKQQPPAVFANLYKAYSAALMIGRDEIKEIKFDFMLKREFSSNAEDLNKYIEKNILQNVMKKITTYPFLIAVQAEGVKTLPGDPDKINVADIVPDVILRFDCDIRVKELSVDDDKKQEVLNAAGGGIFVLFPPYTRDILYKEIYDEIEAIMYPESLINWAVQYLKRTGKNYKLDRKETWEKLAKEVLGHEFTPDERKLINEDVHFMPRFSQYMALFSR